MKKQVDASSYTTSRDTTIRFFAVFIGFNTLAVILEASLQVMNTPRLPQALPAKALQGTSHRHVPNQTRQKADCHRDRKQGQQAA
jgi:UDP-N-acetylglucosamine pyrophosphorylase